MDEALYHRHFQVEETHWWFQGRAAVVLNLLDRLCPIEAGESRLDVGCGTGMILRELNRRSHAIGVDMSPLAVEYARKRGNADVFCQPLDELPRDRWRIRTALLLDVIEHVEDDAQLLQTVREFLVPSGQVLITVPAYPWMWSAHDVINHHVRRYAQPQLVSVLERTGFEIEKLSFYNTWLFLPALMQKWLNRDRPVQSAEETIPTVPDWLNTTFQTVFASEQYVLPWLNFPFGVSLVAIARKQG